MRGVENDSEGLGWSGNGLERRQLTKLDDRYRCQPYPGLQRPVSVPALPRTTTTGIGASLTPDYRDKEVSVPALPRTTTTGIGARVTPDYRDKEVSVPALPQTTTTGIGASLTPDYNDRYRCQPYPGIQE